MGTWLRRTLTDPDIGKHLLRDEGEVIVDEVRKHWVVYVVPVLEALLGLVFAARVPVPPGRRRAGSRSCVGVGLLV